MDYLQVVHKEFTSLCGPSVRLFLLREKGDHFCNVAGLLLKRLRLINPVVKNLDQIGESVIDHWVKAYDLRKPRFWRLRVCQFHKSLQATADQSTAGGC